MVTFAPRDRPAAEWRRLARTPPPSDEMSEPLGRRARKALAARQSMLEAGLDAFAREPIDLVSILAVTEAADVAKGVFYLHFRSKDEFLVELWEHVQRTFLDQVRARLAGLRSQRQRNEAAARQYFAASRDTPRECRFRLRMSSYLADEIGQTGQLTRIRTEFLEQLAGLLTAQATERVSPEDLALAILVDSCAWGLLTTWLTTGTAAPSEDLLVAAVSGAARAAP